MTDRDPNEGSTDPMEPEFWLLGEQVQDRIIAAGYNAETVEGIAVDIHDVLQAAERIRTSLASVVVDAATTEDLLSALESLKQEFNHLRWHGENAKQFLDEVRVALS